MPAPQPGQWDVASIEPVRDVPFMEGAARTAASATIPAVRTAGLGIAGALEVVKKVAAIGDTLAPLFGIKSDMSQRVNQAQEQVFQATDQTTQSMREAYLPQQGEQFGIGGQIVGGVASLPVELAGGLGISRGVEKAADVVERNGTMGQAAVAGGVTTAANVAANMLPLKVGGRVGGAIESALGRVLPGGAKAGGVVGGAATGGALGVAGDVGATAAENAALPEGDQFQELRQESNPAVSGGLGVALGAVAGAAGAPVPRVRGGAEPRPTPGTQASAGAAGTDMAAQRRARAEGLPVPLEGEAQLTEGQATRSFERQRFERETAKDAERGAPLRERAAEQNERILKNFDALEELTGAKQTERTAAGEAVVDPIIKKAEKAKADINAAYDKAREAGDMAEPISAEPLAKWIEDNRSSAGNAGVISTAEGELLRLGGAQKAADGSLVPREISINDLEELRKRIVAGGKKDATNAHFAAEINRVIDASTEGRGGKLYQEARKKFRDYVAEFKEKGAIRDLIFLKRGTSDRITAMERVLERAMRTTDDLKNVRDTLVTAGEDGQQAWREVQGMAMRQLRDEVTKNVARDVRGNPIVSPAKLSRTISSWDQAGKLEVLFGKKGAEVLRDIDEVAKDLFTSPPGAVNTSNTASVIAKWMADSAASFAVTGIPAPLWNLGKAAMALRKSRTLDKKIRESLGPERPTEKRAPGAYRNPFERPPEPPAPAPTAPPTGRGGGGGTPPTPAPAAPRPGYAPILKKLPVGEATEQPATTGRAPDLPKLPVGEVVTDNAAAIPAGEARELDPEEFSAWQREHGLGAEATAEVLRVVKADRVDSKAVDAAAVQHGRQTGSFARAIDRIIEKGKSNETGTAETGQGGKGLPGESRGQEGGQQGQRLGQESAGAAPEAKDVTDTPVQRAIKAAREEFDKATEPTGNPITDELSAKLRADYEGAVREYSALPDSNGGTVLNADIARELSPSYIKDRTQARHVHDPASAFISRLYAERLAGRTPEGKERVVMFTAGGTGAGKSSGLALLPDKGKNKELIYDTTMSKMTSAVSKIEQALKAGRDVEIIYTYADPGDAFRQALRRAAGQKREFGSGRTVPLQNFLESHVGASRVIRDLIDKYRNDHRVQIMLVDNSRGKDNQAFADIADLPHVFDNGLRERAEAIAKAERDAGTIDDETLAGFLGSGPTPAVRVEGVARGIPQGPERSASPRPSEDRPNRVGPAGPIGSDTSVTTVRGMRVPVRYRLVDVGDVLTSHTDDLKVNPDFPREFQPRDRTRAASEAQIAKIQQGIRPELLADSPLASDGAPIMGPDGFIESGNARTIALRRAYANGQAEQYRQWLAANADRFGMTADQVKSIKRPLLIRERTVDVDRAEFARQANEQPLATMSDSEQALSDSKILPELELLTTNEDGTISLSKSSEFIRNFLREVASESDRGRMLTADGSLSQYGAQRIRNAVFAKAYGDSSIVEMVADDADGNVQNVLKGLLRAAPGVARLRELVEAGARRDDGFVPDLVEAVRRFAKLRADGKKVDQELAQSGMFGGGPSDRVVEFMRQLEIDSRSPRRIADMVQKQVDTIDSMGDPRQSALLEPKARYSAGLRDEASGADPPKPGEPFIVYRVGSSGELKNRNAGNADAIGLFLGRLDDFDRPQPKGSGESNVVTAFRVVLDKPFGKYERGIQGRAMAGAGVGRLAEKFGTSYSFPASGFKAEPIGTVSLDELRKLAKQQHGDESFDYIGGRAAADVVRSAFKRPIAKAAEPRGEYRVGKLADDLAQQQGFLQSKAEAAGFKTVDDFAASDFEGFMRAAEEWRAKNPADELRQKRQAYATEDMSDPERRLYHGTALPFDKFEPRRGMGGGYDHQGPGVYLTSDGPGYARFFARAAASTRSFRDRSLPKDVADRLADSDGTVLSVKLDDKARVLRLEDASPEIRALFDRSVGDKKTGELLRANVLAQGYDALEFREPNSPEGWDLHPDARTTVVYRPELAKVIGHQPAETLRQPQPMLTPPTREGLQAAADRAASAEKVDAAEQKRLADKAKANAELPEFTLTGSNRAVDVAAAGGQQSLFEPRAPYARDLFGDPVQMPKRRMLEPKTPASFDTDAPAGMYLTRTILGKPVERELSVNVIRNHDDAASATKYLYRSAVERFDGIVTDKAGKPLGVVGGFKGAIGETSVYPPTLLAEAVRIPGAAAIWFSHNHPSGSATLSQADKRISEELRRVFDGSGIEPKGVIAVAGDRYSASDVETAARSIPPPSGAVKVPVIERELKQGATASGGELTSPDLARQAAERVYRPGEPGMLLLDSRHRVTAWVPVGGQMSGQLKGTGGLHAIYRAVSEANPAAALIVHGGELDAKMPGTKQPAWANIGNALRQAGVRPLDVIDVSKSLTVEQSIGMPPASTVWSAVGAATLAGASAALDDKREREKSREGS